MLLGVGSAVAFFRTDVTRDLIMWASDCILCTAAVALLKIWYWMEMQRVVVTREIKRVQLQIAGLATRLRD